MSRMRVSSGVGRRDRRGLLDDACCCCCCCWLGLEVVGVGEAGCCLGVLLPLRLMGADEEGGIMREGYGRLYG